MKVKSNPVCDRETCFANSDGECVSLTSSDFGDRQCPFYKSAESAPENISEIKEYQKRVRK